ncbi:MAG TPA: ATP-dependent Clp protease ATP-binding subunit [Caldithrix sp.]|nr:ATP-dependent Clp protease ATP-binding subunit [Caldithrix sp.]
MKEKISQELKRIFNPEFLNRLDDTIFFRKLSKKEVTKIIDLLVGEMMERLLERNITLELSEGAKEFLAEKGYDPILGARPLKRALQKYVEDPLADEILNGRFEDGSTVKIKMKNKKELGFYLVEKSDNINVK